MDQLTGDDKIDRETLLTAEFYNIEDDQLYKVSPIKEKKRRRLDGTQKRLCIVEKHGDHCLNFTTTNLEIFQN